VRDTPRTRIASEPGVPAEGGENVSVRSRSLPRRLLPAVALLILAVAACGDEAPAATPARSGAPSPVPGDGPDARDDLAARGALALDKPYAGLYSLDDGTGPRDVVATTGVDGTWRVDVSRGVQGGTMDVSIVSTAAGVYQCTVATAANPITPACTKVADKGKRVPKKYSPRVERLFRPALAVFTDRQSALTVTEVPPLSGAKGTCYSVDSISASLDPPVDVGIYCYAGDGVLTAARVGLGVLKLVSQVAGPPTVPLPGPETDAVPMSTVSPPPALPPSAPAATG
jgi:hypothetical protein